MHASKRLRNFFLFLWVIPFLFSCAPSAPSQVATLTTEILPSETPISLASLSPQQTSTTVPSTLTPIPEPICKETSGVWLVDSLPAEGLNVAVPFKIYLPPCYGFDPTHRYPLLILLHGSGDAGDENMWPNIGVGEAMDRKIADGMAPFLVVTPRIYNLQGDFLAISQTIAKTLVAYVDAHYRTKTGAANQALGGLSYGAIWTLRTATNYPQDFSKLGLHSNAAVLDDMVAFSQKMLTLKADKRPLIWLDAGVNDYYLWSNTKMDEVLNNDRISHFWHLGLGAHEVSYWQANLDAYLSFYATGW